MDTTNFPIEYVSTLELFPELLDLAQIEPSLKPPSGFWVQGRWRDFPGRGTLQARGIAIVGAREPQFCSLQLVRNWVPVWRDLDLVILSGFARGIDAAAHEAAVQCGLPTIAFLGCGHEHNYPSQNARLRTQLLHTGSLLISEYAPSQAPLGFQFLARNRLLAALSKICLVVEAKQKSGALNTAAWASRFSKTLYAVPHFPGTKSHAGNCNLLRETHTLPILAPEDLLGHFARRNDSAHSPSTHQHPTTEDTHKILDHFGNLPFSETEWLSTVLDHGLSFDDGLEILRALVQSRVLHTNGYFYRRH